MKNGIAAESLTKTTARALRWNYAGMMTKIVLSFGINTLLARLLGPRPFGELAVAMIVFGFGNLLANIGLTSALIQKRDLEDGDIRFGFTCQMVVGTVLMIALVASAPFWAAFFHDEKLVLLLRVFSTLFVLQAFGTTSTALLNRAQNVQVIQTNAILSYLVGYLLIGVPMAMLHYGIWSLVAAWLSQAFLNSALTYLRCRHSLAPLFDLSRLPLLAFGFRVLASNVCSWGISNLDNTIVARTAGPVMLGYYSRAFTLASMADSVTSGLLQVLLPAFSRIQHDTEKLRNAYPSVFGLLLLALLPGMAAVSSVAGVVVVGLYGEKWAPAIEYVRPIALALAINAVMAISGPLLAARGRPDKDFRRQIIAVVIAFVAYVLSVRISVLALSWTVLLVYVIRLVLLVDAVNQEIGSRWMDLLRCSYGALFLACICAASAKVLEVVLHFQNAFLRLLVVAGADFLVYVVLIVAFGKFFVGPCLARSPQLSELIPRKVRHWVTIE